jgi:hypothetical protein
MVKQILSWIKPFHFDELIRQGISLDQVYLLAMIAEGYDTSLLTSSKERALLGSLQRKLFLTAEGKLSPEGEKLFDFLASEAPELPKTQLTDQGFEEWWKTYPGTDTVVVEGKVLYEGSRSLRQKKEECRLKYIRILMDGGYTARQLLDALKVEVQQKITRSVREKQNVLKYMQNSLTYLNQRTFENFIELGQTVQQAPRATVPRGSVNI